LEKIPIGSGSYASELLKLIVEVDDDGNRLGYTYQDVLKRVLKKFPKAKTTTRTLAWYASDMRCAGIPVPFRPRSPQSRRS